MPPADASIDSVNKVLQRSNRQPLLAIRMLYFCYFMIFSIYGTYINVYLLSIGLTGLQIGLINTIAPFVGMFSSPLWGMFSDRLGNARLVMMLAVSGSILTALGFTQTNNYLAIVFLAGAYSLFASSLVPLLDSTTLLQLGSDRRKYGLIRVWGTIGFIFATWVSGLVFERFGLHVMFYWMIFFLVIFLVMLRWLPGRRVALSTPVMRGLFQLMQHPSWLLFSLSMLAIGIANNGLHMFLGILIKQIGGNDALIGKAFSLGGLTEIPIMLASLLLLRRFSPRFLLGLAFILFFVRLSLFSAITDATWVLPINLLHGVTFGLYWIASVAVVNEIAPDNLKATAQGTLISILSLSGVLGGLLSGWIFDSFGVFSLFRVYAVLAVVALLLLVFLKGGLPHSQD